VSRASSQSADDDRRAQSWLHAAANPEIAKAIDDIYAQVASEIARRGPACWASGRCCNFEAHGHRLYVTALETALTLHRLDPAARPTIADIDRARSLGGCPFQQGNLCGIHAIKPLGCRVYFCDRSAESWQHELTEAALASLRQLHDQLGIEYLYAEWRGVLELLATGTAATTPEGSAASTAGDGRDAARDINCNRSSVAKSDPVGLTIRGNRPLG
jgi:Fe-S-cluster containining protein